jgi:hypothetical protein
MSIQYGYYLPLGQVFANVRYLSIVPKMTGFGPTSEQKSDKDGTPVFTVSALVQRKGEASATENFSLTATSKLAEQISKIAELTPIKLHGLAGGKWVQSGGDKTTWSFQITGVEVVS